MAEQWTPVMKGKAVEIGDLAAVSKELLRVAGDTKVWMFYGEMGSGKTTLIKEISRQLGVKEGTSSPTFSIVNEYSGQSNTTIYHFDFYRLKKESEAYDMGVEEYFESGLYCFVEWPERVESLFPLKYFKVRIQEESPSRRIIDYMLS